MSRLKKTNMIKIGTRSSPLALVQAHMVKRLLSEATGVDEDEIEIVAQSTAGDRLKNQRLIEFGGKGLFTKEIEDLLLTGHIDVAVHSMKDVPTRLPDGLVIPCCLEREDVRDAWISPVAKHPQDLPVGARVGTCSLRRAAQILNINPDVEIVPFRGNVGTRLKKLGDGQADGTLLALAGLKRLGQESVATSIFSHKEILPAPAQGAIGIECRTDDSTMISVLEKLNHKDSQFCVNVERAFLRALDGSCRTPMAALATLDGDTCHFSALVSDYRGQNIFSESTTLPLSEVEAFAIALGAEWKEKYGHLIQVTDEMLA